MHRNHAIKEGKITELVKPPFLFLLIHNELLDKEGLVYLDVIVED